jgi:hypothetical protein
MLFTFVDYFDVEKHSYYLLPKYQSINLTTGRVKHFQLFLSNLWTKSSQFFMALMDMYVQCCQQLILKCPGMHSSAVYTYLGSFNFVQLLICRNTVLLSILLEIMYKMRLNYRLIYFPMSLSATNFATFNSTLTFNGDTDIRRKTFTQFLLSELKPKNAIVNPPPPKFGNNCN